MHPAAGCKCCCPREQLLPTAWLIVFDMMKKFIDMKVMKPWNRLHRVAAEATSLKVFKAGLDEALSNQIHLNMTLPIVGKMQ